MVTAPVLLLMVIGAAAEVAPATGQQIYGPPLPIPSKTTKAPADPCRSQDSRDIVVCAQRPESDRYRVPKELRGKDEDTSVGGSAWGARVED